MIGIEEVNRRFDYHPPTPERAELHAVVRGFLKDTAILLDEALPSGREAALVQTKLEEALFWANAAIAREGK